MKFLPIENVTYRTNLTEDEVIERLAGNVELEDKITISYQLTVGDFTRIYVGELIGQHLKMERFTVLYNPHQISGVINNDIDGLKIKIKMNPPTSLIVLLCFCYVLGGIATMYVMIHSGFNLLGLFLFLFGTLFIYIFFLLTFKLECHKSKQDLKEIFQAEIIEEQIKNEKQK
jgi:hypothetical protein